MQMLRHENSLPRPHSLHSSLDWLALMEGGPGRSKAPYLRAFVDQHKFHRVEYDHDIEQRGHVLDVEKVILQLFHRVFNGIAVFVVDLCPTGDTGLNRMP